MTIRNFKINEENVATLKKQNIAVKTQIHKQLVTTCFQQSEKKFSKMAINNYMLLQVSDQTKRSKHGD